MNWLDNEIKKIKEEEKYFESHYEERRVLNNALFKRWLIVLTFVVLMGISTDCFGVQKVKQLYIEWVCEDCDYDNYDQISSCGLCGKKRPWSNRR